ncbi:MAG: nicotinate mononucleotide-dependent phosphoribosyltransferase CobT [Elainellaceae cyanobacterium]
MIRISHRPDIAAPWLERFRGRRPSCVCVLGFTETGLVPGISAAGATPADRQTTAIADAEFLYYGPRLQARHALPPLQAGASPAVISRAVIAGQAIPLQLVNAGLPQPPTVPHLELEGHPARCVSTGHTLPKPIALQLFRQGLRLGETLAQASAPGHLIVGECVVGGTTTALAVLKGLGVAADGRVNSSHPNCNHRQKQALVEAGLQQFAQRFTLSSVPSPLDVWAGLGDPMQGVIAALALTASQTTGVLLAGGTQMLAVYHLMGAIARAEGLSWNPDQVVVGTTRWVTDDPTGDTLGLAQAVGAPLLTSELSFAPSRYPQLRAYEAGHVKEGVAAGGCAIAAHLYQNWRQGELLSAIEALMDASADLTKLKSSED